MSAIGLLRCHLNVVASRELTKNNLQPTVHVRNFKPIGKCSPNDCGQSVSNSQTHIFEDFNLLVSIRNNMYPVYKHGRSLIITPHPKYKSNKPVPPQDRRMSRCAKRVNVLTLYKVPDPEPKSKISKTNGQVHALCASTRIIVGHESISLGQLVGAICD